MIAARKQFRRILRLMPPYEKLRAWKASHETALLIYRVTMKWPKEERYGLTSQARRAALSVPLNIAEGVAKRGRRELRRFLDIALGSASELCYILRIARDLGVLSEQEWQSVEAQRDACGKQLWRLYDATRLRGEE